MNRENYPGGVRAMLVDIVHILWTLAVEGCKTTLSRRRALRRRGSHAGTSTERREARRSRARGAGLVCLVPLVVGPLVGLALAAALDLPNRDSAAGGQPTRRTVPLTKVVETSTGTTRPVPMPTSAYDGQGPSIEPDRRPVGQNPTCWVGTPGWPHDC